MPFLVWWRDSQAYAPSHIWTQPGPTAGTGYELSVLAATIIGGVKLTGGRGSILGVLLGLCVIGIFQNLIVLWGVSPNWTQGVSGLVLIAAMTLTWARQRE